jgi:uncharacterized membrane protein (DUF485 family)
MNESTYIQLRQNREFGQIISDIIAFFKQNLKALLSLYVKYGLSIMVIGFLLGLVTANSMSGSDIGTIGLMGGMGNITFFVFFILATIVLTAAVFGYVQGYVEEGQELAAEYVSRRFWSNLGRVGSLYFVLMLAVAAVGLLFFLLFDIMGAWIALLIFIGSFVAIYLFTKVMLAPFIACNPDTSVFDAIGESFELTEGKWWWTFGLYFVMSMIGSLLMYIIMIPLMLIFAIPMFVGFQDNPDMSNWGSSMLILNFVTYASYSIYGMVLILLMPFMYYALYDRKYGSSIHERIDDIEIKRDSIFENEGEV